MMKSIFTITILLWLSFLLTLPGRVKGEKIVMATDREVYIAGDRMYFSLSVSALQGNASDYGYITLTSGSGNPVFKGFLKFDDNRSYGSIYLADTLITGIYQLIAFTNTMRNQGESAFARKNILIVNRFDKQFSGFPGEVSHPSGEAMSDKSLQQVSPEIILSKSSYHQREKITIRLNIPDSLGLNLMALSVRQKAPVLMPVRETSGNTFSSKDPCFFLPEKNGIILQGRALDENRSPVENKPVFLSCEDSVANLQYTLSGKGGIFRFFLNPGYFGKYISVKTDDSFKGTFETDDKFSDVRPNSDKEMIVSGDILRFIENNQNYLTIRKAYQTNYLKEFHLPASKGYLPYVYYGAPLAVYPADFAYLPDFMEISREILPFLKTRENREGFVASVINLNLKEYTRTFIFVDGILVEDVNQIIHFDSKILKKIEIVPFTRFIGELEIPGIVSVSTSTRETEKLSWKRPVVRMMTASVLLRSTFNTPDPGKIPGYFPDFRPLLFWQPEPAPDSPGIFLLDTFTSDCTGEFEVVLTCTGHNGQMAEFRKNFSVNHE